MQNLASLVRAARVPADHLAGVVVAAVNPKFVADAVAVVPGAPVG